VLQSFLVPFKNIGLKLNFIMSKELTYEMVQSCVAGDSAALRVTVELTPTAGPESKIFPPTYIGTNDRGKEVSGAYAKEERIVDGKRVLSVLLDSVGSQANRMELALLSAIEENLIQIPLVRAESPEIGVITSLEAPHRIADAIFRDCLLDGVAFRDSDVGRAWTASNVKDATSMFNYCPTALLFGQWDSTGLATGSGNRFQRNLVSEIVAHDVVEGVKVGGRKDPLEINTSVKVYKCSSLPVGWTCQEDEADKDKNGKPVLLEGGKPSEINHGNIAPTISHGGVTFSSALHTSVISLTGLRKLRFPLNGKRNKDQENAARVLLVALGLVAVNMQVKEGYDLRSRCQLRAKKKPTFEILGAIQGQDSEFDCNTDIAIDLFNKALSGCAASGMIWEKDPIILSPSDSLKDAVKISSLAGRSDVED